MKEETKRAVYAIGVAIVVTFMDRTVLPDIATVVMLSLLLLMIQKENRE